MKIYVASSWRNQHQQQVVALLRQWGHQVYDYTEHGFNWGEEVFDHILRAHYRREE